MLYLLCKSVHFLSFISWMAGLLYLPRIFVYHSRVSPGSEASEIFKIMEQRLLRIIMIPAISMTWISGLSLISLSPSPHLLTSGWFRVKLALVFLLSIYHMLLAHYVRAFQNDCNSRSEIFYRVINEFPSLILIAVIVTIMFKPF